MATNRLHHQIRRLASDCAGVWKVAPKAQALRWYAMLLRQFPTIARTGNFYAADAAMGESCAFKAFNQRFDLDLAAINSSVVDASKGNAYAFLRELFVRRIYFRAFTRLAFDSCLDLGCNIAIVATVLRKLGGPGGKVVAVDPLTYPTNDFWLAAQNIPGLVIERAVVFNSQTIGDSQNLQRNCEAMGFDPLTAATVQQILDRNQMSHVSFLKMDIEGAEFAVFSEPTPWLDHVDNIAMEVHNECGDPNAIVNRLKAHGFATSWSDDYGYPVDLRQAGYIYASRTGDLKH